MFAAALLGAVALTLAACGGRPSPESTSGVRIGFVPKSLNQEYWVNTRHGAEAGGRAAHAKVVTLAAQSDTHIAEQIDLVENLLAQKVDALVIAPNDSDLLKPVLEKAAKRIPVVLFDSPIPGWKPQTAYVGTANKQGGVEMGKYLRRVVPQGTLAIIPGIPGSQVDTDRVDGVKEGVKGGGIKVVKEVAANFDRQQAVGAMEDILQTNPHVSAVFCANDQMALGALQTLAARQLDLEDQARRLRRCDGGDPGDPRQADVRDGRAGPLRDGPDRGRGGGAGGEARAREAQREHGQPARDAAQREGLPGEGGEEAGGVRQARHAASAPREAVSARATMRGSLSIRRSVKRRVR